VKLTGTLFVVGKVGPFDVMTEEAVRGLHEKLEKGLAGKNPPVVPLLVGDAVVVGACTAAEISEHAPGRFGIRVEVDVDDDALAAAATPPALGGADAAALEARLQGLGQ
jgi:hypothetical protein